MHCRATPLVCLLLVDPDGRRAEGFLAAAPGKFSRAEKLPFRVLVFHSRSRDAGMLPTPALQGVPYMANVSQRQDKYFTHTHRVLVASALFSFFLLLAMDSSALSAGPSRLQPANMSGESSICRRIVQLLNPADSSP